MKAIQDRQTCDVEAEPSNMDFDTTAQTPRSTNTGKNVFAVL